MQLYIRCKIAETFPSRIIYTKSSLFAITCAQFILHNGFHLTDQYTQNDFNICGSHRRLSMASAPLELAWLHHEFCKFLSDIHRFDLARFYARKGRDFALKANCDQWVLNVDHLMLRIEIHQNNRNEAKDAAILALATARKLDIDCLVKIKSDFANVHTYILLQQRPQLSRAVKFCSTINSRLRII